MQANELRNSLLVCEDWDKIIPKGDGRLTDDEVESARLYPMDQLIPLTEGHKIVCPFHDDSTPSMYVYDDHVHCYVCGKHLDTVGWVMETGKMSFYQAVKQLQ